MVPTDIDTYYVTFSGNTMTTRQFFDDEIGDVYKRQAIAYLVKQGYKPQWKPKRIEDYNFSPNNQSTEYLW